MAPGRALPAERRHAPWLVSACSSWKMGSESSVAPWRSCCRPGSEIGVPQLWGCKAGVPTGRPLVEVRGPGFQVGSLVGKTIFLTPMGPQSCLSFLPCTSGLANFSPVYPSCHSYPKWYLFLLVPLRMTQCSSESLDFCGFLLPVTEKKQGVQISK